MKKFALLIVTLLMMGSLSGCGSVTIDLNDYITIETEGYDSLGTAVYEFDYEQFEEDYAEKIEVKEENEEIKLESAFGMSPIDILYDLYIDYEEGEKQNLSNGDTLVFTWDCDEEAASKYFGCKLKYEDIEYEVKNLTKVDTFDPFEHLTVSFTGISPRASISMETDYTVPEMQYIEFQATPMGALEIGEEVTVTAKIGNGLSAAEYVEKFGVIPGETEKTYTTEGVSYYLTNLSEIPDNDMEMLKNNFVDWFKEYVNSRWNKPETLGDIEYLGNYFLISKPDAYSPGNYLYLIFKVHATHPITNEEVITYQYIYYKNIIKTNEEYEYGEGNVPSTGWFMTEYITVSDYTYVGFATLDDLYKNHIETKVSSFEFTTDIKK